MAAALRESWPDHPEWVDMLTGILEDEPMGTEFGWFRTARTQTRFDWEATRRRYDRDGDGRVTRQELSASDADFARLDRNHDGALTPPDFDFSGSSLAPSPGSMLFGRADRDGNGKVTREELEAFFRAADSGGQGFLSLSDLQEAFAPPPSPPGPGRAGRRRRPWSAASSVARSARSSPARSSTTARPTSPSRPMTARTR